MYYILLIFSEIKDKCVKIKIYHFVNLREMFSNIRRVCV